MIEARLQEILPRTPWSVKNQARMHLANGDQPYCDTFDAMRHWLETPTCVAVRLHGSDTLELAAPYGIDDLLDMVLRPTPAGRRRNQSYGERIFNKNWLNKWPNASVIWPE